MLPKETYTISLVLIHDPYDGNTGGTFAKEFQIFSLELKAHLDNVEKDLSKSVVVRVWLEGINTILTAKSPLSQLSSREDRLSRAAS